MSALLYRRKPLTFSVIRWDSDPATQKAVEAWLRESKQTGRVDGRTGTLDFILAERSAYCAPGDYLVRGIDDEVYPVLARRFAQLYEAAPAAPATGARWIGPYGPRSTEPGFQCSACNKFHDDNPLPERCSRCGAEMST